MSRRFSLTSFFIIAAILAFLWAPHPALAKPDEPEPSEATTDSPDVASDEVTRKGVPRTEPGCIRACKGKQSGAQETRTAPTPPDEPSRQPAPDPD